MRSTPDDTSSASADSIATDDAAILAPENVMGKLFDRVYQGNKSGFGEANKYQRKIIERARLINAGAADASAADAAEGNDASSDVQTKAIHPSDKYRYYNFPGFVDSLITDYNANQMTQGSAADTPSGVFIGEGPIEKDGLKSYSNAERFFTDILFNDGVNFKTILALGYLQENTRIKFLNYFKPSQPIGFSTVQNFEIRAKLVSENHDSLHVYDIEVLDKRHADAPKTKRLRVFHIPNMPDMGALEIDLNKPSDRALTAYLLSIQSYSQTDPLFIHCSAGLGRSGLIAYVLEIYKNYDRLIKIADEDARAKELHKIWENMNKIRPGTIQKTQQLLGAFPIVEAMRTLQAELIAEKEKEADEGRKTDEGKEAKAYLQKLIPELIASTADADANDAGAAADAASNTTSAEIMTSPLLPDEDAEFPAPAVRWGGRSATSSTSYDDDSSPAVSDADLTEGPRTPADPGYGSSDIEKMDAAAIAALAQVRRDAAAIAALTQVRLNASTGSGSHSSEYPSSSSDEDPRSRLIRSSIIHREDTDDNQPESDEEDKRNPPSPGSGSSSS